MRILQVGTSYQDDAQPLLLPPSQDAKGYKSMYAYNNHTRVKREEVDLFTCDSGVAPTFLQFC